MRREQTKCVLDLVGELALGLHLHLWSVRVGRGVIWVRVGSVCAFKADGMGWMEERGCNRVSLLRRILILDSICARSMLRSSLGKQRSGVQM